MASFFDKLLGKDRLRKLGDAVRQLERQVETTQILAAQSLVRQNQSFAAPVPLAQTEFKVFSQFGDDGIIQYVLHRLALPLEERRFVEFGVESYREANTRFLLINNNWSGLVMDGSAGYMAGVRRDEIYWRHELAAQAHFITRENIDGLLRDAGFTGRIGLLSIDLDGNDYWVWQAIASAEPALVIVEYNGLFGRAPVTIPYDAGFVRHQAHESNLYWGTSLGALCHLAAQKGYVWIGCNTAGNNAYFVRQADSGKFLLPSFPLDFIAAKFREGRHSDGSLSVTGQREGIEQVKHLRVWNVAENRQQLLGEIAR